MNLRSLLSTLKAAIDSRDWLAVAGLVADAIKLVVGPSIASAKTEDIDDELGDVAEAVEKAKGEAGTAAAAAIDPATVLALVGLVIDLIRQWQKK